MKARISTTEAADRDIGDIVEYVAIDNPIAARQFGAELSHCFALIGGNRRPVEADRNIAECDNRFRRRRGRRAVARLDNVSYLAHSA